MKNCFIVTILFLGLAFNGNSITAPAYNSVDKNFSYKLQQYIKDQKYKAGWALYAPGGFGLDYFSKKYKKGTSVDTNELSLLTSINDAAYEQAVALQDQQAIQSFATKMCENFKYIEDANKWHDILYEEISKYNAEKLFNNKNLSRSQAIKKMLDNKNDTTIHQQFVFGIAVTMVVEEMMKSKK